MNSSIFYNPAFTWDKYTNSNKKEKSPYNLVNPGDVSFPGNTVITINSLFPNINYVTREEVNGLVNKKVDFINYASFNNVVIANIGPDYRNYLTQTEANQNEYFRTTLRLISKIF